MRKYTSGDSRRSLTIENGDKYERRSRNRGRGKDADI